MSFARDLGNNRFPRRNRFPQHLSQRLRPLQRCGYCKVGRGSSNHRLTAKAPFVVIDEDSDRVRAAIQSGCLVIQADETNDGTLGEARIERAKGIIAALAMITTMVERTR
jgi:hypothetical protein